MNNSITNYKIYGRRKGRKKNNFANNSNYKKFLIDLKKDLIKSKKIILDVGSGNGENSIFLAKKHPRSLIIACDIFEGGNINLCNEIQKLNLNNIKLFVGNVIEFFDLIKLKKIFNEIWILFPDPWPKKKHHKRRLININFFEIMHPLLKKNGHIFIATDSISYFNSMLENINYVNLLYKWLNTNSRNWNYKSKDLADTKFFKKAKKSMRSSFFIDLKKI